jgi:hypothetical protein
MKRAAILLAALALSGCAHVRYVTSPCVSQEQLDELKRAEPPKIHDKLTGRADEDIKPMAGSNIRLRAWGNGLLNVLGGCVG